MREKERKVLKKKRNFSNGWVVSLGRWLFGCGLFGEDSLMKEGSSFGFGRIFSLVWLTQKKKKGFFGGEGFKNK